MSYDPVRGEQGQANPRRGAAVLLVRRIEQKLRALIHRHGPESLKKQLWNKDYLRGLYGYGSSAGDFLYPLLAEQAHNGSILDLGCGEGKTENELDEEAYSECVGVDISEVAIARAKAWTERSGRARKTRFHCSNIQNFVPSERFNVILFRESLYYVPLTKMKATLDRYSAFLKEGGCFVVRLCEGTTRHAPIVGAIEANFKVIGKHSSQDGAMVIVFRNQ